MRAALVCRGDASDHGARPGGSMVFEHLWRGGSDRSAEATSEQKQPALERPKIALALGGGAARGFAHIGVIRTLIANGIKPDVIVGTSIGAVVGGCYAAGKMDEFEAWSLKLTRRGLLSYLDISLSGSGLISGDKLATNLEEALGDTRIEDLPIPFATITTEVGTGHEIWLTRGRLVDALRASYALPGIFPPVRLGGRWLVDGALVNPVPVSAARVMGARLVIAVNLNADILGRGGTIAAHGSDDTDEWFRREMMKQPTGLRGMFGAERALKRQFFGTSGQPGIPTVMADALNIMQDRITRARLAGDPPDVTLTPRLGHIGWFDFHRAKETVEIGARTCERGIDLIDEAIAALSTRPAPVTPATEK
jgi:NTE family protein